VEHIKLTLDNTEYISVNKFKNNRRTKANLVCLTNFYIDCDIYNTDFGIELQKLFDSKINKDFSNHEEVLNIIHTTFLNAIFARCKELNIECPTRVHFSGRGYQLFWKIKAKNSDFEGASPKLSKLYGIILVSLVEKFTKFGADKKATDVSRVFKCLGQINTKSMLSVDKVFESGLEVSISHFADSVLKYALREVNIFEARPASEKQLTYLKKLNIAVKGNLTAPEANRLIRLHKVRKIKNSWFKSYLDSIACKLPAKGSNSNFAYIYGIASKKTNSKKTDIFYLSNLLDTDLAQIEHDYSSGLNAKADFVSKNKINMFLNISSSTGITNGQKKRKKYQKVDTWQKYFSTFDVFMQNTSVSQLVKLTNLSKSSIKRIRSTIKTIKKKNDKNITLYQSYLESFDNKNITQVIDFVNHIGEIDFKDTS
jgi:hypothetical protein